MSSKYIKIIYKTIIYILVSVVIIPSIISLAFLLPEVQSSVAKKVVARLSYEIGAKVSINRIYISPLLEIRVTDMLVCDQSDDTLLFVPTLRTGIDNLSIKNKKISLEKISLQTPVFNLYQQNDSMNFDFLFKNSSLKSEDSVKWSFFLEGVLITNGNLSLTHKIINKQKLLNDKLFLQKLNLDLNMIQNDSVNSFTINDISFVENSGLQMKKFSAELVILPDLLSINKLYFQVNNSIFDIKCIEIPNNKSDSVKIEKYFLIDINKVSLYASDFRMFLENFPDLQYPVGFSGTLRGSIDNLKGNNINIRFGEISSLTANFDIQDLSNRDATFIYLDVKDLRTSIAEIEHFIKRTQNENFKLPPNLKKLGLIKYKGNFTGFINDIVAYGLFETNLGKINTDLGVKIREDNDIIFAGLVNTENFELSKMIEDENPKFHKISFDIEVKGNYKSEDEYFVYLDGDVWEFEFKKHQYNDIKMNGLLTKKKFDGSIIVKDPNGRLNFLGKVDMSKEKAQFNFLASIENAQLDRLNLLPKLEDGVLSLVIESNFEGNNFDDLVGEINLINGLLYTPKNEIDLNMFSIKAENSDFGKRITLKSDFAEGELKGKYKFRQFNRTINNYLNNFIPSFVEEKKTIVYNSNAEDVDFEFNITLKEINMLTSLLLPDMNISNSGNFKGSFNSKENKMNLVGELEHINFKNIKFQQVNLKLTGNDQQSLSLTTTAAKIDAGNFVEINNISIHQIARKDSLTINMIWNDWQEINNSGFLSSDVVFGKDSEDERMINIALHPSSIKVADEIWKLEEAEINFHSKGFSVKGLEIENRSRFARLDGFQHREIDDNLVLMFKNLNLGEFFQNSNKPNLSFAGMINGELGLQNYYREPLLSANINIDDFIFNGAEYGTFRLNTSWDKEKEALTLITDISDNDKDRMIGAGVFHPKSRSIDIVFKTDSLNIEFLNPILKNVLQNVKGSASGNLYLNGFINKPLLTGTVKVNDGGFYVKLLNASYTLADSISFYPNEMRFNNMTVNDIYGHKGVLYGSIFHKSFKDMNFKFRIDTDNMLLMNTRQKDNPSYYGTVYATGSMQVTGTSENTNIIINGRTQANTRFFIPVTGGETASENSFINFVAATSENKNGKDKQSNVSKSGVNLEMDIEVTPEAEIQIIFDERLGDILKGYGAGNLQLRVDRLGNIRLYGDYKIESGEYFFSLKNLINKRFSINSGATLRWQGDPTNAVINITAVYKLKTSLSDLFGAYDNSEYSKRRVPINCNLILTENLKRPVIKFDVEAPTLDESTETMIKNFITSEEEMNRQVLSLLVLNRFSTPEHLRSEPNVARNDAMLFTTTGMLLSQLSRWVSTLSSWDVGVAYHMEDDLTSEEIELALSKQILNRRVTLNGNVGYGKYYTSASKMIGDFEMDVKLFNTETVRAKAYTRTNEYLVYETAPTTQGIGFSYREEYSSFHALLNKYKKVFRKKEGQIKDDEEE